MTRNDIASALRKATGGQAFITVSQLAQAMGRTNQTKVKQSYLQGLEAVDGKYYLVTEVAGVMKERCKLQG